MDVDVYDFLIFAAACVVSAALASSVLFARYVKQSDGKSFLFRALPLLPAAVLPVSFVCLLAAGGEEAGFEDASLALIPVFAACAAVFDMRERIIPFALSGALALSAAVPAMICIVRSGEGVSALITSRLSGLALGAAVSLAAKLAVRKGLGWGDVAFICASGAAAGASNLFLLMLVCFAASAIAGVVILILRKGNLKTEIPMAPFLLAASLVCAVAKSIEICL